MDIIKFNNPTYPTYMEDAQIVEGFTSKLWIERYRQAGEFKFVAPIDSGMRAKLPLGSLISHLDTRVLMIVENHEISDDDGRQTDIVITGRSFESFLEHRVVGSNMLIGQSTSADDFLLGVERTWWQAVQLIRNHVSEGHVIDDRDAIPHVVVGTTVTLTGTPAVQRRIKPGTLYARLQELLEIDDLGITVERSIDGGKTIVIVIHNGTDRSDTVSFSYEAGDVENSDYLWSVRGDKNSAYVKGKWVQVRVNLLGTGYTRRVMYVDGTDIDSEFQEAPAGIERSDIVDMLKQRGLDALSASRNVVISKLEAPEENNGPVFRQDYDLGDIVKVYGDYSTTAKMRITEYAEIEDENGVSGTPTFVYVRPNTEDYTSTMMLNDPVAYWPLNERLGSLAVDYTGNGNDAVFAGDADVSMGVEGPFNDLALRFNGSVEPLVVPFSSAINPPAMTLEMWIRPTGRDLMNRQLIMANDAGGGYDLNISFDNKIRFRVTAGSRVYVMIGPEVVLNQWLHVIAVANVDSSSLWINSAEAHWNPYDPGDEYLPNTTADTIIGSRPEPITNTYVGDIAHLAVYNKILTKAQIITHYEDGMSLMNQGV